MNKFTVLSVGFVGLVLSACGLDVPEQNESDDGGNTVVYVGAAGATSESESSEGSSEPQVQQESEGGLPPSFQEPSSNDDNSDDSADDDSEAADDDADAEDSITADDASTDDDSDAVADDDATTADDAADDSADAVAGDTATDDAPADDDSDVVVEDDGAAVADDNAPDAADDSTDAADDDSDVVVEDDGDAAADDAADTTDDTADDSTDAADDDTSTDDAPADDDSDVVVTGKVTVDWMGNTSIQATDVGGNRSLSTSAPSRPQVDVEPLPAECAGHIAVEDPFRITDGGRDVLTLSFGASHVGGAAEGYVMDTFPTVAAGWEKIESAHLTKNASNGRLEMVVQADRLADHVGETFEFTYMSADGTYAGYADIGWKIDCMSSSSREWLACHYDDAGDRTYCQLAGKVVLDDDGRLTVVPNGNMTE